MCARAVIPLLLLAILSRCALAEVRTWTDRQGKTTRAEFVRVHEGRVVLKSGTQTLMVPLSQLSDQDKQYVEGQLNRKSSRDKDDEDGGQPVRFWTDTRGNQIAASYVRMNDTQVVLADAGRIRMIGFTEISEKDREYIKELLRAQGQEQLIAALERHVEEVAKADAAAREAARQSAPQPSAPAPANNPFLEQMREREEARQQEAERHRQESEQRRQAYEAAQAAERERRRQEAEEYNQRQAEQRQQWQEQQKRWQEEQQERSRQMQERLANLSAHSGPTMVTEYRCSNCNKVVPDNIGAGGNCPHCGVYFQYSQSPTGQRQYASGSSSESGRFRITGRAIKGIIFLVILVGGGAAALWRKISGG